MRNDVTLFSSDPDVKTGLIIGLGDIVKGDEGFGCHVLDTLSNEAIGTSVHLCYMGDDPRWAGGLIYASDFMIVVGTLHCGESVGRLHAWSYRIFQQHLTWMANEYREIRFLAEALCRAELAGNLPKDFLFLWIEPQLVEGFGISASAHKAVWKAVRTIKQKLFEHNLLPESALTVYQLAGSPNTAGVRAKKIGYEQRKITVICPE